MFNRIMQVLRYFTCQYTEIDRDFVKKYLDDDEIKLFENMATYDKKHSIAILKDLFKYEDIKDNKIIIKLALLHDIGKEKNIGFIERCMYAAFKKSKRLKSHPKKGFEYIKEKDLELANLILNHHKTTEKELLKLFQKYDDKN